MRTRLAWTLATALSACATVPAPPIPVLAPPPAPAQADPGLRALLERARPAVVLIVNHRRDGKLGFGAGLIVDAQGHVLTNAHVVGGEGALEVLRYKPGRVTYTPMDGGLARFLFEHQGELIAAHRVQVASTSDLALIELAQPTADVELLPLATTEAAPGDRIVALGHPDEEVWSFTQGVVSALHQGAIQHDAFIAPGSSGGPLLDLAGHVVGINTARVESSGPSPGFARPIAMARWLLEPGAASLALDRSTPSRASLSCTRAEELSDPAFVECFDWRGQYELYLQAHRELEQRMGPETPKLLDEASWTSRERARFLARNRGSEKTCEPRPSEALHRLEEDDSVPSIASLSRESAERWRTQNGIKLDSRTPRALRELLRGGSRIAEERHVDPEHAWVLVEGRNADGSAYRYSELLVLRGAEWLVRSPPLPRDATTLPSGWPPPLQDPALGRAQMMRSVFDEGSCAPPAHRPS